MAADPDFLTALVRLRAAPDFQTVINEFEKELAEADKANRRLTGEALQRSQGRAIFLEEFLTRYANARATVEKMRT